MKEQHCRICYYYQTGYEYEYDGEVVGYCRRYPPSHYDDESELPNNISVSWNEWCGEFKPNKTGDEE